MVVSVVIIVVVTVVDWVELAEVEAVVVRVVVSVVEVSVVVREVVRLVVPVVLRAVVVVMAARQRMWNSHPLLIGTQLVTSICLVMHRSFWSEKPVHRLLSKQFSRQSNGVEFSN